MRLINAGELMEKIVEYDNENIQSPNRGVIVDVIDAISEMIVEQPTAYDVDKVIEQLEEQKTPNKSMSKTESILRRRNFEDAIEIVKKGGVADEA